MVDSVHSNTLLTGQESIIESNQSFQTGDDLTQVEVHSSKILITPERI